MKLTIEERKNLEHCMKHLKNNKVGQDGPFSGWYTGKKAVFIKRHEKAMKMLKRWLEDENVSDTLAE